MSGGGQRHFLTVNPDTMPGDGDLVHVLKPSAGYGGVTIVSVWARTAIVGTLNLVLQNYGASGTVAGGTVAGMSSGTATVWAAAVPQELAITAAQQFVDSEEWLVLKKVESAADNDLAANASITIEYVDGITTQG